MFGRYGVHVPESQRVAVGQCRQGRDDAQPLGSWICGSSVLVLMVGRASVYRPPSRSRSAWV
jgi:hypothetical protein